MQHRKLPVGRYPEDRSLSKLQSARRSDSIKSSVGTDGQSCRRILTVGLIEHVENGFDAIGAKFEHRSSRGPTALRASSVKVSLRILEQLCMRALRAVWLTGERIKRGQLARRIDRVSRSIKESGRRAVKEPIATLDDRRIWIGTVIGVRKTVQ